MAQDQETAVEGGQSGTTGRDLPPAAHRALREAAERRRAAEAAVRPTEIAGRGGAEPVRYGDWEVKGLATDF